MDLNKAQIIGRLTRDPETRSIPSGDTVTNFSVATGFKWKDKTGQQQEKTEFHNVIAWRKLGEICGQYLRKASKVYIEGRLETRSWEDQSGVKKYKTEIIADNMIMLEGRGMSASRQDSKSSDNQNNKPDKEAPATAKKADEEEEVNIEDIPF